MIFRIATVDDSLKQSNIGKYEEVKDSLAAGNKIAALQKLSLIVDENIIEQNKKYVSTLIAVDYNFETDADSDTLAVLQNIAFMHPFYGGEAVYWARAMLHLVIEDILPPMRRMHPHQQNTKTNDIRNKGIVYPNPANDKVTFSYNGNYSGTLILKVHDKLGRLVQNYLMTGNNLTFNTDKYVQGIYQLTLFADHEQKENYKLIIIK